MPKPTFLQLPPAKHERFVHAALREFADHPYDSASITRLVAELGIAKGSVYQYFDDKFDLFSWLVAEAGRRKLAAVGPIPDGPEPLDGLARMYADGLRWWAAEPLWARLSLRVLEPSTEPRLDALRREGRARSLAFVRDVLCPHDPHRAPLILAVLTDGLLGTFLHLLGVDDPGDLDARPATDAPIAEAASRAVALAMALLREGMHTEGGRPPRE